MRTDDERERNTYLKRMWVHRRIDNGLCPKCGKENHSGNYYCDECRIKEANRCKENRIKLKEMGICPKCQTEMLFGDERTCLKCKERAAVYRETHPLNQVEKMRMMESNRKRAKSKYKECSENGICTRCGKRPSKPGRKKCAICLLKDAEVHRIRYKSEKMSREEKEAKGLCIYCGKPLDHTHRKLCAECWEECHERGVRNVREHPELRIKWKQANRLISRNKQ